MNKAYFNIRFFLLSLLMGLLPSIIYAADDAPLEYTVDKLIVLEIDATINPAIAHYLQTEITRPAPDANVIFIIKINTPGGLVSTTKDIISTIGKAQHPIVLWVTPEGASATSAGAIIASATHGLVMSQGTNIGAATPVGLGDDIKEGDGRSKAVNDLSALVKSLSETRGRNADAFANMISTAASYPSKEALKLGIIDGIVSSLDDIRALYQDRSINLLGKKRVLKFAPIVETQYASMDSGLELLNIFANPTTAYILFVLGAALIYFEFQAPGGYIAGGTGAVLLVLAAIGFQVLPLNFGAIVLMVVGFALLVLEIFITSYGLLALAGLACFGVGSLFLFRHEDSFMTIQYSVIYSTLFGVATALGIIAYVFTKKSPTTSFYIHDNQKAVVMSYLGLQDGSHIYQVKVKGEIWKAASSSEHTIGSSVVINQKNQDSFILEII